MGRQRCFRSLEIGAFEIESLEIRSHEVMSSEIIPAEASSALATERSGKLGSMVITVEQGWLLKL